MSKKNKQVDSEVPTLEPIVLFVAVTGVVKEQEAIIAPIPNIDNIFFIFFIL